MSSRIQEDVSKLFEFWCEITRCENDQKSTGIIIESFPEAFRDEKILSQIPYFAYPCDFENESVQSYSFVLTCDDSKFRFGFCRHDPKTQTAMIVITYLPWHDTFLRLLGILAELRRTKNGEFESFLSEAYNMGVPEPGASLKISYNVGQNHFIFQKPSQFQLPSIPENHNLNLYYNFVDPKNMIAVFASMLAERRIIFTSRRLDKLSSCVQAANAFLYPMVWQHIFIPVLPMKMKDILSAPMPYLIGVPEAVLLTMTPEELGDVVTLNCDTKNFQSQYDDVREMPPELVSQMKKQLSNTHEHMGDRVSKIFLGILVQLIGGYRDAVRFSQGQKITWDSDAFVDSRPPNLRGFIAKMMHLQIFQQFIDERLNMLNTGLGISDEFEMETVRHSERKRGKNYKEFLKNVKDKTNPAVKSAVKSVKESSRGVKTAYKDLKSKFRDVTPPKSQFHMYVSSQSETSLGHPIQHRSAPNSPILGDGGNSKRTQALSDNKFLGSGGSGARKNHPNSSMQTSNSQNLNGFISYTSNLNNNHNINNSHLSKSPTISPSSSLCSSDMNISQELQNHPLFKSPSVDRSLKPSQSLEYSGYRSARSGAPIIAPNQQQKHKKDHSIQQQKLMIEVPIGNLCVIDDDEGNEDDSHDGATTDDMEHYHLSSSSYTTNNDSMFDKPPDMPSPPIPPKRTNNNNNNSSSNNSNISTKSSPLKNVTNCTDTSFGLSFENNFVNNQNIEKNLHGKEFSITTPAAITTNRTPPIPAPRNKIKELPKSHLPQQQPQQQNATKDLISLDDANNTSFELEDFDPLNQNARPLPNVRQQQKSGTLPSTSTTNLKIGAEINNRAPSVHNPLYPYFTPQHRPNHKMSITATTSKDDDIELLKKYGLDQFKLSNGGNSSSKNASKSNWMTFE